MLKIDWHSGFVSAMKLEFIENENDLTYHEEHQLANRSQRIDLLIIKNENASKIINPIGSIFSRFNVCEYKSPEQSLSYGDFYKVLAYTGLHLYETYDKQYNANDYTITFVREPHPYNLFTRLRKDGIVISSDRQGIYRLSNKLPFKTQVIVTKELPREVKSWLKCLTRRGTYDNLECIISNTRALNERNKQHADNIMNIFTATNMDLVNRTIKEEPSMCQAVNELFADEINQMKIIIADKDAQLADIGSQLAGLGTKLNDKDEQLASKDAIIAKLQAELEKYKNQAK